MQQAGQVPHLDQNDAHEQSLGQSDGSLPGPEQTLNQSINQKYIHERAGTIKRSWYRHMKWLIAAVELAQPGNVDSKACYWYLCTDGCQSHLSRDLQPKISTACFTWLACSNFEIKLSGGHPQ